MGSTSKKPEFIFCIDPGHPSIPGDRGTVVTPFVEEEWALEIGFLLRDALFVSSWPIGLCMTHTDHETVTLAQRGIFAAQQNADFVLSLHADWHTHNRVCGPMVYHGMDNIPGAVYGRAFINALQRSGYWVDNDGRAQRRTTPVVAARPYGDHYTHRAYAVLVNYRARLGACLVEHGYASNVGDREWMMSQEGKHAIVAAHKIALQKLLEDRGILTAGV